VLRVLGKHIKEARASAGSTATTLKHCSLLQLQWNLKAKMSKQRKPVPELVFNYTGDCALESLTLHEYLTPRNSNG